jgi:hypothetical protein
MAFDVYVGGFSRFYAREWENVAQKHARETGMRYQVIHAGGDPGPAKWEEVQAAVEQWKTILRQGLRENAPPDLDWDEGRGAPYFTDRPGWDGYSALVVLAACAASKTPCPDKLPKDALTSDVVVRSHAAAFQGGFRSLTQVQLWLPGSFEFSFDFFDLCKQKMPIGSVKRLSRDLQALKEAHGLSDQQVATSLKEGYGDDSPFMPIAIFGLAIFERLANEAIQNRLPILLSF